MKIGKSKIRQIVSWFFALMLTLMFFVLLTFLGLFLGYFRNQEIRNKISESSYYNKAYQQLEEDIQSIMTSYGMPSDLLQEVITLERVYVTGRNYVEHSLKGVEKEIPIEEVRKELDEVLTEHVISRGTEITTEVRVGIDECITHVLSRYQQSIRLPFINEMIGYKHSISKIGMRVIPVAGVLALVLILLLLKIHPYKHQGVRYINYSVIASSSLISIGSVWLLSLPFYQNIQVEPEHYSLFIKQHMSWSIKLYLILGIMGLVVGVTLFTLIGYMKRNITKK